MKVLVHGGLGNQMFQFAFALALQQRLGVSPLFVDLASWFRVPRPFGLSCFGVQPFLPGRVAAAGWASSVVLSRKLHRLGLGGLPGVLVETEEFIGPPRLTRAPYLVSGYWQGWRYFQGYEGAVREAFTFPRVPERWQVLPHDRSRPWVAVHVRRGDYVSDPVARAVHLVCDASWYRAAWQRMQQQVPDALPVVFSDDPGWARGHLELGPDAHFVPGDAERPAWADLAQMSQCRHFVMSNSSYSWWAAWLGHSEQARVIAPAQWLRGRPTASLGIGLPTWQLL